MRARLAILIVLMAMVSSVLTLGSPAWSSTAPTLAQETEEEGGDEGGGNEEEEGGGSESGEAAEETGPPWTYQMARIALVLLALTILGVAFAYYRFVATRRREGF